MSKHVFKRAGFLAATIGIAGLLSAGVASAHVTANIYGPQLTKGGFGAIFFRVPNEEPDAKTSKVVVEINPQYGIGTVSAKPIPGWTATTDKSKLATPITNDDGAQITEAVSKVTWTAEPGNELSGEAFQEFEISLGTLPKNVDQLEFPAHQTYSDGKVIDWTEQTKPGADEPEHPAPVVKLAAQGTDTSGMGMTAGTTTASQAAAPASDSTARWLGGAGLVVGALGLGVGAGAIMRSRRIVAKAQGNE